MGIMDKIQSICGPNFLIELISNDNTENIRKCFIFYAIKNESFWLNAFSQSARFSLANSI